MNIPILLYHSVTNDVQVSAHNYEITPKRFKEHMAYLKDHAFCPMTISEIAEGIRSNGIGLTDRPVAITFDDGFRNFLTDALPILVEFGYPATLYIATGYIGDRSDWLSSRNTHPYPMLSWQELKECARNGIEIGSHSHSHRQLDILPHVEACGEINHSKSTLENHLGAQVLTFSFPHGYHTMRLITSIKEAGYTSCCIVDNSIATSLSDVFMLPRLNMHNDFSISSIDPSQAGDHYRKAKAWRGVMRTGWRFTRYGMSILTRSKPPLPEENTKSLQGEG